MREILSPLSGIRSPFGQLTSPLAIYAVLGSKPELVLDFDAEKYFVNSGRSTFSDSITHARSGNATMVDSDGLLKWAPHNLLSYSEQFDNAAWSKKDTTVTANAATAPDGTTTADALIPNTSNVTHYVAQTLALVGDETTYSVYIKPSGYNYVSLSSAHTAGGATVSVSFELTGNGSIISQDSFFTDASVILLSDGWYLCSVAFDPIITTPRGLVVSVCEDVTFGAFAGDGTSGIYIWGAHVYRSDLGGMVDNPDQTANFASYVPTTSSAVYLPRRGHHVYNGSEWVNEGLLHESEARTNLCKESNDFSTWTIWNTDSVTLTASALSQSGLSLSRLEITDTTSETHGVYRAGASDPVNPSVLTSHSAFFKADEQRYVGFRVYNGAGPDWYVVVFDLQDGIVTQESVSGSTTISSSGVESYGNGLYRCYVVFSDSVRTSIVTHSIMFVDGPTPTLNASNGEYAYSGTAGDGLYVGGIVIEQGSAATAASTPSSYIPTSGSTVTRAAETLTVPAANMPWPSPVVIGSELVTNGTFDTDSDWTLDSDWSISNGKAIDSGTSSPNYLSQAITTTPGSVYLITFDVSNLSGGSPVVEVNGVIIGSPISENGSHSRVFTATTNTPTIKFYGALAIWEIDNVSVKEINPLAVSIQMDGRMTYADEGLTVNDTMFRWYADSSNLIQSVNSTSSTRTGRIFFQQSASGTLDEVSTAGDYLSPDILVPFNIASRHGSTFVNGAVDGVALTADTTPTALPDLETTDLQLGYDFMGTIGKLRVWADDLGDSGIEEASS
jgi:hypothetical protein